MTDHLPERAHAHPDTALTQPTAVSVSVAQDLVPPFLGAASTLQPLTPTPPATAPQPQTSPAALIAALKKADIADVEASLVRTTDAYRRGEVSAIETALIDQHVMLQSLGIRLIEIAAAANTPLPRIQVFANLGLRAVEASRKSLETLRRLIPPPAQPHEQTK